ncbi:MAG: tetratricopeptide repeat protein [Planctomycetota bacterium]
MPDGAELILQAGRVAVTRRRSRRLVRPALVACALLAAWIGATPGLRAAQEVIPDKDATRKDIDDRIAKFVAAKQPPTLGLLKEVIDLSISYGAPAYDNGDHDACYSFYRVSTEALLAAFEKSPDVSPAVVKALHDLRAAHDSALGYAGVDKQAWALRYGFDKVSAAWQQTSDHQVLLVGLGSKYFQLGLYAQAQDSFHDACGELAEVTGTDPSELGLDGRVAPFAYSRALFTLKDFDAAARWQEKGFEYLPEWPTFDIDPVQFYGDRSDHDQALAALEAGVKKQPDKLEWQLLLGTEYFFLGRKDDARKLFDAVLAKDPKNHAAAQFVATYPDSDYQKDLAKEIAKLGSSDRKIRADAFAGLVKDGRYAIPALHLAEHTVTQPDAAWSVRELLRRMNEPVDPNVPRDRDY